MALSSKATLLRDCSVLIATLLLCPVIGTLSLSCTDLSDTTPLPSPDGGGSDFDGGFVPSQTDDGATPSTDATTDAALDANSAVDVADAG